MKSTFHFLLLSCALALPVLGQAPAPTPADPFETGMREAFTAYKKGDNEAVGAKLRELLKILDEKGAEKLGSLLPDMLGTWKGEAARREDLTAAGNGIATSRTYVSGPQKITVRLVKNHPKLGELLPLFVNEELLKLTNRKVHKISGVTAVMEGENKIQLIVDERIYIELEGEGGAGETELVDLAGKLDLPAMAKIK